MKLLFIGNSHTYFNDMPALVKKMIEAYTQEECDVCMLAYSGRDLQWHRKEYFSERFNLLYGNYDCCIIQQAAHPFPAKEELMEYGRFFIDLCRRTNTEPVLFHTWPEKRYPGNLEKMAEAFGELSESTGARLAPVGPLFSLLTEKYPQIDLYWEDGEHASVYGDYLIALTIFAVITGDTAFSFDIGPLDFGISLTSDFSQPLCKEDLDDIPVEADRAVIEIIKKEVREYFTNGGKSLE